MEFVAKYFNKTVEECEEIAVEGVEAYWKKWHSQPHKTDKQCREFYKGNDYQIYKSALYRKSFDWRWFTEHIKPADKVLDYGCGIGKPLECFIDKKDKPDITLADVDSATFKFVKWKYGDSVKYLLIENNHPLKEKYDWIICLDVLEHIPKAYKVFKHLLRHLKTGGNLIFWYEPSASAGHLPKSTRKNRPKVYYKLMRVADWYTGLLVTFPPGLIDIKAEWWKKRG